MSDSDLEEGEVYEEGEVPPEEAEAPEAPARSGAGDAAAAAPSAAAAAAAAGAPPPPADGRRPRADASPSGRRPDAPLPQPPPMVGRGGPMMGRGPPMGGHGPPLPMGAHGPPPHPHHGPPGPHHFHHHHGPPPRHRHPPPPMAPHPGAPFRGGPPPPGALPEPPPGPGPSPGPGATGGPAARAPRPEAERAAAAKEVDKEQQEKEKAEKEKAELISDLTKVTARLSFQEVRSNFDGSCSDLKSAIKKLDKLLRRVRRAKRDDISQYPQCAEFSRRAFDGIKHVLVLCGTGYGKTHDMEGVRALMKAAVTYRHDVFAPGPKRELEGLIRESREFRYLFENRDKDGRILPPPEPAPAPPAAPSPAAAPSAGAAGSRGGPRAAASGAGGGPGEGSVGGGEPQASVSKGEVTSEASHAPGTAAAALAAAAAAGGAPADGPPSPPPPPGAPAAAASGVGGGGSGGAAPSGAAGGGGVIRIVINSSADRLGAPPPGGASGLKRSGSGGAAAPAKRARPGGSGAPSPVSSDDDGDEGMADAPPPPANGPSASYGRANGGAASAPLPGPPPLPLPPLPPGGPAEHQHQQQQQLGAPPDALLRARRLILICDLDHMLVNSARPGELDPEAEFRLQEMLAQQHAGGAAQDLLRAPRTNAWLKLRPGARDALRRASEKFELWLRTAGGRAHAAAAAEALGPRYFGGRLIAQGDEGGGRALAAALEGREALAIILDDAGCEWAPDRRNLLVAERYAFLPNALAKGRPCLLEVGRDECPQRGMLAATMQILDRLHGQVFERVAARAPPDAWDVRGVMDAHRRRVLSGVHLVFSRVLPPGADPRAHPLWRLAEAFGGTCAEAPSEATTHVVAARGGTEKVMWALDRGKQVVSPAWLECSCTIWHRANEGRFQPAH